MPRRPLPVALHLDPEDLAARMFPEEVHPPMLEAGVLLDVVDLGASHLGEEHLADQRHGPQGGVLDRLHAVGACHGLTFQRGRAAV